MEEVEIPQQRVFSGACFPLILSPGGCGGSLIDAVKAHKPLLESQLLRTGAILFRGFPVNTPSDFNDVVEAFGFEELPYVGGAAPRTNVVGRVFTANESPPDQKIPFHHEMAQVPEFPSKLFFFCELEPRSGGETPIVLSHVVYERMKQRHPAFVEKLERLGLIYIRVLGEEDDPSSPIGRGWKSTFLTHSRDVAEQRAAKLGMKLEWLEDGGVKTVMGPIPGVKFDKRRQRKIWFNSMVAAYTGWEDARNDPVKAVTFGDGSPLPPETVHDCLRILEEESVAVPWSTGDVLLLDNWAVLHARRSFEPPRRVLASLCRAAKLSMKLEWLEDGRVKTVMGPIPGIKFDKRRQRKIWFNSMVAAYMGWEDARNDHVKAATFGDGNPLPPETVHDCLRILEEELVAVPWSTGDVLLLDNWTVLHAHRSFEPPRRVLASLCR